MPRVDFKDWSDWPAIFVEDEGSAILPNAGVVDEDLWMRAWGTGLPQPTRLGAVFHVIVEYLHQGLTVNSKNAIQNLYVSDCLTHGLCEFLQTGDLPDCSISVQSNRRNGSKLNQATIVML